MFYQECDECQSTVEFGFPSCRDCGNNVCPACMEPGTERADVDLWDCLCKNCADLTRVWLKKILAVAFTPASIQASIDECMTSDQHDRDILPMDKVAESLRERVLALITAPSRPRIQLVLEAQLDADKVEDLLSDEFVDLKWVASHLQDFFEQELWGVLQ